jgi:hypothetical protein
MAIETRQVETNPGMAFETSVDDHADASLVLMLHGFAFLLERPGTCVGSRGIFRGRAKSTRLFLWRAAGSVRSCQLPGRVSDQGCIRYRRGTRAWRSTLPSCRSRLGSEPRLANGRPASRAFWLPNDPVAAATGLDPLGANSTAKMPSRLIFPYDDPTCVHSTAASACICGSTLTGIDATSAGDGEVSASKNWNHRCTQMHTDDCDEPGRQMIAMS